MKRQNWQRVFEMTGVLGWSPRDWSGLSLRELCSAYDAKILDQWDRTSILAALTHNLAMIVVSLASKRNRTSFKSAQEFNPYRKKKRRGLVVTTENFGVLKQIGNTMSKKG